ncbi:Hypothetical predicted protein [Olea europaea subsp. europaea]|uniref:Uncharacterized protein n=1 Tax=Olea europaea subsp. europaea TaxID=158383 RepID=A0A8S0QXS3_OLEEU|nr:Hypothetical predicted protein [Olea europaea subsp. europaea]
MPGRNKDICHSCRLPRHMLPERPTKTRCRKCGLGFVKCMEVEKKIKNIGRLFKSCTRDCGYFKWIDDQSSSQEPPLQYDSELSVKLKTKDSLEDSSSMLKTAVQLIEELQLEISINITIRKRKGAIEDNGKGKGKVP